MSSYYWHSYSKSNDKMVTIVVKQKSRYMYQKYTVFNLPVCVRVCLFKSNVSLNPLPQNVQRYRLMSEWHFMCLFSKRWRAKVLLQMRQQNVEVPSSLVIEATLTFSSTRAVVRTSWFASGFLIPWPPLTNSSWTSDGRPSWGEEKFKQKRGNKNDSTYLQET